MKIKAERNKTIDISIEDGLCYLNRCINVTEPMSLEKITDKTIVGDTFEVLPFLPEGFADLLIVDPPYNLDKDFHGKKFKKTSDDMYEEYFYQCVAKGKKIDDCEERSCDIFEEQSE